MLINGGWNGDWTRYCVTYPQRVSAGEAETDNEVERFFLTQAPAVVATQQRAVIFSVVLFCAAARRRRNVGAVRPHGRSSRFCRSSRRAGADRCRPRPGFLELARESASTRGLLDGTVLARSDAWDLTAGTVIQGRQALPRQHGRGVDVITSNGLNIYVDDDAKVVDLYASFRTALRPGGHLVVKRIDSTCGMGVVTWTLTSHVGRVG